MRRPKKNNKGVYKILCKANGKFYVGSSVELDRRTFWHFHELRYNKHANKHLQSAFNKYAKEAFVFSVVEFLPDSTTLEEALEREQFYLDTLKPWDHKIGFNMLKTAGVPGSFRGHKHSPETLKLMSEQRKGKPKSAKFKRTLSEMYKGKSMKERTGDENWTCNKRGRSMKEITGDPDWVDSRWGRKHTPEAIQAMKDKKQGPKNPSFDPVPVTLVHKKTGKVDTKTRCEWRNLYEIDISKLESGRLKTTGGWALITPPNHNPKPKHERTPKSSPRVNPV